MSLRKSSSSPSELRVGAHPGQRGLHGLLHDLADLAGHGEAALALHAVGFDEEHIAARRSPGQADRYAGALGALGNFGVDADLDAAQEFLDHLCGDDQLLGLAFGDAARLLAADGADLLLQLAHARLARVVAHDVADRFVGNSIVRSGGSMPFSLICRGIR